MLIQNIDSKQLLPEWAHGIDWIQVVFDALVKRFVSRIPVIDCPLTLASIQGLTDSELQEWYARYGVVEYYPELSRTTRENLLYWLARLYRYLGTPESVRVLCDYIFDEAPLSVDVRDNLAFNADGELVDESLLDLFDIAIDAETSSITLDQYERIVRNVLSIARNSQTLRNVYFRYDSEITVPMAVCDFGSAVYRVGDDDIPAQPVGPVPVGPSVGDIITLGRYPQATSTPEDIEWVVLAVDTANHRALLVSKYALTARQFDVSRPYSGNYWGTSTLRTWLNGDFWNDAFTVYDQAAIILSDLDTNGTATQDHVFILTISDANDYFSSNSDRLCIATQYAINQNIYNTPTEHYAPWWLRTKDSTTRNDYAAFVESDGAVHADGYSATDTHFGIRPAIWLDYTTPVITFPGVIVDAGWVAIYPNHADFPPNELREGRIWGSGGWVVSTYDPTKTYAAFWWHSDSTGGNLSGHYGIELSNYDGKLGITNVLSYTIPSFIEAHYSTCDSPDALVVVVYNSTNEAYTAFKFTQDDVDYYFVLDEIQTDWTDNLSSIGYHLPDIDIDTNFGDAVSIPSGYTVQSVKASRAYAVGVIDYDEWNYFFDIHLLGQDVYCSDTDTNLLGISVDPCIGMFQITTINSQGSYSGYHLSCRSSQTTAIAPRAIENKELNQNGNFISARLSNVANPGALQNCHAAIVSGKPMIIRKYDSSGNLVEYYMNVPQSLWQFQNGVFSWLGDSTSQSDMAYYYKGTGTTAVRIHCVAS